MSGRTNSCSRYSTGAYVEKQGIREDALCNKGFNNVNVDKQFNLNRPAFRSGTLARGTANVLLPKNRRDGAGNRNLQRILSHHLLREENKSILRNYRHKILVKVVSLYNSVIRHLRNCLRFK